MKTLNFVGSTEYPIFIEYLDALEGVSLVDINVDAPRKYELKSNAAHREMVDRVTERTPLSRPHEVVY